MEATATSSIKEQFLSNFVGRRINANNTHQTSLLNEAIKALEDLDFPTSRDEYWKYTRVNKLLKKSYTQSPVFDVKAINDFKIEGLDANLLVFVNGFYSEELSEIREKEQVIVLPLAKAWKQCTEVVMDHYGQYADQQTQIFTALNSVYHTSGVFVYVKDNGIAEKPIHIINLTKAKSAAFNPRNLFVAGKNSHVKIISSFETIEGGAFTNSVSEIVVSENANLEYNILQHQSDESSHINTTQVAQKSNSTFSINTITTKGGIIRNNLNIEVNGEGCETNLNGLYLLNGSQHVDNHTLVDHKQPNCNSNELYKGIINEKGTGVFNGKVFVRQDAQKTNAFQSNQNILLTDNATINSKPELEIYADDVKCSHGSTTGQLDEEAIFYLRSRGLNEESAKHLLLTAFARDVLNKISIEPLLNKVEAHVYDRYNSVQ